MNVFLSSHGKFKAILEFCKKLQSLKLKTLVGKSDPVWAHAVYSERLSFTSVRSKIPTGKRGIATREYSELLRYIRYICRRPK